MKIKNYEMKDIQPFDSKVWLASPTMHGEEQKYVNCAFEHNWITTAGENVNEVERLTAKRIGVSNAVALSAGTVALHMAMKLAGEKLYGKRKVGEGSLSGKKVFCSDVTFAATVNPIVYEGGEPVFIDAEYDTWNMDPQVLKKAFEIYPDVKLVVLVNLYGTPAKLEEIKSICEEHGALLIEDAAESLGAQYKGRQTGTFGEYAIVSFNGNKIITGSSGGCILVNSKDLADKVRKWSTQAREAAPWYQHEELGYNYRMSNIIAGIVRGQYDHIDEHITRKKAIYERYKEGLRALPISMNPYIVGEMQPNFWLSCMIINKEAMCKQVRSETDAIYISEKGKSCPTEILETMARYNVEGRPIWKPMHMQPLYRLNPFIARDGIGKVKKDVYIADSCIGVGMDIFNRGLCLPSDINMTEEQQDIIISIIRNCFE